MDKKGKYLILLAITALLVVFCNAAIGDFFMDRAISADPALVEAKIVKSEQIKKRSKKGRVSISYDFTYEFEANGQTYKGEFGTSERNADPYLQSGVVQIMYNKSTPEKNDLAHNVDTDKTIGDLALGLLMAFFFSTLLGCIGGAIVAHKLGWLIAKKEPQASEQPEQANQPTDDQKPIGMPQPPSKNPAGADHTAVS